MLKRRKEAKKPRSNWLDHKGQLKKGEEMMLEASLTLFFSGISNNDMAQI